MSTGPLICPHTLLGWRRKRTHFEKLKLFSFSNFMDPSWHVILFLFSADSKTYSTSSTTYAVQFDWFAGKYSEVQLERWWIRPIWAWFEHFSFSDRKWQFSNCKNYKKYILGFRWRIIHLGFLRLRSFCNDDHVRVRHLQVHRQLV